MTSHRDVRGYSTDQLGNLIRWALHASVGCAQPPAHVWTKIKQRLRSQVGSRPRQYVCRYEHVRRRREHFYWSAGVLGVYPGGFSLSLACIVELQMPALRGVGWVT